MDMPRQRWTLTKDGRLLVGRVVKALRILPPGPFTDDELAEAAGLGSRDTLYRVQDGKPTLRMTLVGLDGALELPPGTLESIGAGDSIEDYEIRDDQRAAIRRAQTTPTATGSNQTG